MLIEYTKHHEKTAMELFSLLPGELNQEAIQNELDAYEKAPGAQLYLWQQQERVVGMIGIQQHEHTFAVRSIAVEPAERNQGIGCAIVDEIQELQQPLAMSSTAETKEFLEKCWEKQNIWQLSPKTPTIKEPSQ